MKDKRDVERYRDDSREPFLIVDDQALNELNARMNLIRLSSRARLSLWSIISILIKSKLVLKYKSLVASLQSPPRTRGLPFFLES
jgi:hypothetical protein